MRFPVAIVNGTLPKRGWRSVYSRDAVDALVDLHDAVEAGHELYALKPYLDRLAQATHTKWRFSPALATPILIEFCEAVQDDIEISMVAYLDRLAWCTKRTREEFVLPMAMYNTLQPEQAELLRLFGPVRVVATS